MDSENDEEGVISYKAKYRQLKSRLKFLIYEHECFENDIQKAQTKLLQLSRDKNFLLDQLMRYEAVVLSGGEETDCSSGEETAHPPPSLPSTEKVEGELKSETGDNQAPPTSLRGSAQPAKSAPEPAGRTTNSLPHTSTPPPVTTLTPSQPAPGKSGGTKKTGKDSAATKVSAMAAAKITKAVARARQNPESSPTVIVGSSPLIVSLPLGATSVGSGRAQPQTAPMKHPSIVLGAAQQSTAAILASIPVPAKPSRTKPTATTGGLLAPTNTCDKVGVAKGAGSRQGSSTSSSSSSSDSEESASESSSSDTSREEVAMETGGPVPIVRSVPLPAGGPQLLRPKALPSPVKAPPKLIPVSEHSPAISSSSPLVTPTGGGATRFLWSNRIPAHSGGETTPTAGFISIIPLTSPTLLTKPSSGSAFQLVTTPPGTAPLVRPPSLQDLNRAEPVKPHPPQ